MVDRWKPALFVKPKRMMHFIASTEDSLDHIELLQNSQKFTGFPIDLNAPNVTTALKSSHRNSLAFINFPRKINEATANWLYLHRNFVGGTEIPSNFHYIFQLLIHKCVKWMEKDKIPLKACMRLSLSLFQWWFRFFVVVVKTKTIWMYTKLVEFCCSLRIEMCAVLCAKVNKIAKLDMTRKLPPTNSIASSFSVRTHFCAFKIHTCAINNMSMRRVTIMDSFFLSKMTHKLKWTTKTPTTNKRH